MLLLDIIRSTILAITRKISTWYSVQRNVWNIRSIRSTHPLKVIIGASSIHQDGWIATDIHFFDVAKEWHWSRLFKRDSIDNLLAEHVWEHLSESQAYAASRLCYKHLKHGARIRIAVPDGFHPDSNYIDSVRPNGTGAGASDHKVLYTHTTLSKMLTDVGFHVNLIEYFSDDNAFNHQPWDDTDGFIHRSAKHDSRNREHPLKYTSLIVDAIKQ